MAIRKSELYSSLWASCDELRGGMDASQYKDYVLVLLFLKYISDKYAGAPYAPLLIPEGSGFAAMVALKGKAEIGDRINKEIIAPLVAANQQLSQSDFPDFNDQAKLGSGKELVERLTNLIAIFEKPELNFSGNRADDDDILGDAYEYLMRHFASESGKSKGQFYTPAEVSRIKAQVLGIEKAATSAATTVCDPTCGSGSLLLKVAAQAGTPITLYGQEKDEATSGLARMNMILHGNPTATIWQGNTLADPKLTEGEQLKQFDFVVANPPFSDKRWSTGLDAAKDKYGRFEGFGIPPNKQGDYAYLLHIVRTLKSAGRGSCILPHGVLFRGNAEAEIRRNLVQRGLIKGIIGLPANLFYGTGIPACIVVIDKRDAGSRQGIFLVDASKGFMKDGPKNRLRERDIHKIVDVFTRQLEVPGYARFASNEEIAKNDYNLNLPRYIDSSEPEDLQDIEGHLRGGIPERDLEALAAYWAVCPSLRASLFRPLRTGYLELAVEPGAIRATISAHAEFAVYLAAIAEHFQQWRSLAAVQLKALEPGCHPKQVIGDLSEGLLLQMHGQPLLDAYGVYQLLLDQWADSLQDDVYAISADGWKAEPYRVIETDKKGKTKDKGWTCDLLPKELITARFFADDLEMFAELSAELEQATSRLAELEEEHGGEEGAFAELEKLNKANVAARIKEIKHDPEAADELTALREWLLVSDEEAKTKKMLRAAEAQLDAQAYGHYAQLSEAQIRDLVVDDKWLSTLAAAVQGELERVSQTLTGRIRQLAERYATPLPQLTDEVAVLASRVEEHLKAMGAVWT
ncbi:SAM-dependent DNA methyltransferase [Cyanobium sp. HWJ4-Hawea]|uniref:HsdM family class I SAM-dependent methyltransferase n=1 Tax=Cyanobium sp. HWJ4-Hawea TaxID=2823713 RepID=UPI0020CFE00F|nr:class I SAM-dependent DNA methyltransferase [Cyanobium sp. HWJ4-Hawea]MCP9808839.1 SAM-dependent DNA methyltransferase [Cyanobium sp. HWJ4-Hawea]